MNPPGDETSLVALAAKEGASPSLHQVVDSHYAVLCILCCEIFTKENQLRLAMNWFFSHNNPDEYLQLCELGRSGRL